MSELVRYDQAAWEKLKVLALDGVTSPHSRRAYESALNDFLAWYRAESRPPISKAAVNAYKAHLEAAGLSASTINVRLSAVRKLVAEAADNGLITPELAAGIARVRGVGRRGVRLGNWLDRRQAERLIQAPDTCTLTGKRDRALFAVLIGCGLRRSEAVGLRFEHIQQREQRWVIVDLLGKHGRVRSVPMPGWAKTDLDRWSTAAGVHTGRVFRPINRGGRLTHESLADKCIWSILRKYTPALGLAQIAPHDLRRSYARLAHQGRAPIEQIQLSLGHESIQTTERYLGVKQDLGDAPCDRLGLETE
ncbi:MAG: tyrosine-type recombinase/integrase [Bryobacteraceae bacterium]|jgi:site-specific recombinase XerD